MALYSLRVRRTLTALSSLINHHPSLPAISASSSPLLQSLISSSSPSPTLPIQSRLFKTSSISLSSARSYNNSNDDDKISPDTILFEGCDYNHWLITMDFPKSPKPTPEQMVETYVQTCAKGLNISVEEAKKKMYACSTTTYTGFQAVMTEEESEKFRGLPGVVFILPDSYIDPANKEYGGDKYINGTIIPRPPPGNYGRAGGRIDRNRYSEQPRYDRQGGPMPNRRGNPQYDHQGSQGDGRNYGLSQNYPPRQNYGPTGQGERRDPMPMDNSNYGPGGRSAYQGEKRDSMPRDQGNYNQTEQGNYYPQEQRDFPQGDRRGFAPPEQRYFRGDNRNYAPPNGENYGQGSGGAHGQGPVGGHEWGGPAHGQGAGGSFGQGAGGSYGRGAGSQGAGGSYGQEAGMQGAGGAHGQGPVGGHEWGGPAHGQGAGGGFGQGAGGSYGQGAGSQGAGGSYGQEAGLQGNGGSYGQGAGGQGYPGHGGGQSFSQAEQRNYAPVGQTGTEQGR
ncbi:hypothetical protein L1049_014774 [Liquidambar formosana]|uniref:MORF/ORRM1/DAG-like MORF domain-containing protein n=1 Tax=Liquidambar formosana TaxID=63359 RepID=A0AAP0RXQ9_LIQFO